MSAVLLAVAENEGLRVGLMVTTLGFGLRHGVDWDHIAAISDITSSQDNTRRSLLLATLYAVGHATVVFALGVAAIVAGDRLSPTLDAAMERVVGATLLLLGAYVFYALIRHGRDFRMRSRWMLLFSLASRIRRRLGRIPSPEVVEIVHDHDHDHGPGHGHTHEGHGPDGQGLDAELAGAEPNRIPAPVTVVATRHRHLHRHRGLLPQDPLADYGSRTAYAVGMLHGVGAETATQVLVFLAAANAGGPVAGVVLLAVFVVGLVASNTVIALASAVGFLRAGRSFPLYASVAVATGSFSLVMGALFVAGQGDVLPAFFA